MQLGDFVSVSTRFPQAVSLHFFRCFVVVVRNSVFLFQFDLVPFFYFNIPGPSVDLFDVEVWVQDRNKRVQHNAMLQLDSTHIINRILDRLKSSLLQIENKRKEEELLSELGIEFRGTSFIAAGLGHRPSFGRAQVKEDPSVTGPFVG